MPEVSATVAAPVVFEAFKLAVRLLTLTDPEVTFPTSMSFVLLYEQNVCRQPTLRPTTNDGTTKTTLIERASRGIEKV